VSKKRSPGRQKKDRPDVKKEIKLVLKKHRAGVKQIADDVQKEKFDRMPRTRSIRWGKDRRPDVRKVGHRAPEKRSSVKKKIDWTSKKRSI